MEGFEFLGPYAKRIFGSNTPSPAKPNTAASKKPTDFSALHKKKNVNFGRSAVDLKVNRLKEAEERRKNKRTQVIMENRSGNLLSNGLNLAQMDVKETNGVKESRKEQLSRWKQEKEAIKNNNTKKAQFKSSGPASALPTRLIPLPPVKKDIPGPSTRVEKPKPTNSGLKKIENGSDAPKRVTRAMTKAQASSVGSSAIGMAAGRFKDLKITAKPVTTLPKVPTSAKTKKLPVSRTPLAVKKGIQPTDKSTVPTEETSSPQMEVEEEQSLNHSNSSRIHTSSSSSSEAQQSRPDIVEKVTAPEPQKKAKKPKGMQFDAKYVEYNQSFIKAGELLKGLSDKWDTILVENTDIPEDIIGQINSSIGQAKLLLYSKLPQFAELLYFYLSRQQDSGPVLACDLEGWWDVAIISIEKVEQLFVELAALQANSWEAVKKERLPVKSKQTSASIVKKSSTVDSMASPKIKSRPNAGLMQFLAQKRKKINQADRELDVIVVSPRDKPMSPERKFEGGFFDIRSPVRKPCSPSLVNSNLVSREIRRTSCITPSRRQSEVSLRMLAVRNSMGPICKIGLVDKAAENHVTEAEMD